MMASLFLSKFAKFALFGDCCVLEGKGERKWVNGKGGKKVGKWGEWGETKKGNLCDKKKNYDNHELVNH